MEVGTKAGKPASAVVGTSGKIGERLREELDYEREAKHVTLYRDLLAKVDEVRVPVADVVGEIDAGWAVARSVLSAEATQVGTTGDSATPLASSRKMAETLEDGRLIVNNAQRHTGYGSNDCVTSAVDNYLITTKISYREKSC